MGRVRRVALALLAWALPALGQDAVATGTIALLNQTVAIPLTGKAGVGFQIVATSDSVSTIVAEATYIPGGAWFTVSIVGAFGTERSSLDITGGGTFTQSIIAPFGASHARLRASAYTAGSALVTLRATAGIGRQVGVGAPLVTTGQVSCTTSATLIVAQRIGRRSIGVTQIGTTIVYLGDSSVTTTTGDYLAGVAGSFASYPLAGALYCIVGAGSQTVTFVEVY